MADVSRSIKQPFRQPKVRQITAALSLTPRDSGQTIVFNASAGVTVTLPKVTKALNGINYKFTVKTLPGSGTNRVAPNAADQLYYHPTAGTASTAGQGMDNTNTTDNVGSGFSVIADADTGGWVVLGVTGAWAKS